jgi:hypothetical protein
MRYWAARGRPLRPLCPQCGQGDAQRGTSPREDILDTVIPLKRPPDYTPENGASFEVHFEKSRGFYGYDSKLFEASLNTYLDGQQMWATLPIEESTFAATIGYNF